MPIRTFKYKGHILDVPDDRAEAFLSKFPDAAEMNSFTVGKDTLDIPKEEPEEFMLNTLERFQFKFPKAKPLGTKTFGEVVSKKVSKGIEGDPGFFKRYSTAGKTLGNLFDLAQTIPTAAIPHGEGTFLEKLERDKRPSEITAPSVAITVPGIGRVQPGVTGFVEDMVLDPINIPGFKLGKAAVKGTQKALSLSDEFGKAMGQATKSLSKEIHPLARMSAEAENAQVREVFLKGLRDVKILRGEQEKIYTQERGAKLAKSLGVGKKVSGEKGFHAELAQFKGEMTKVEFESLRGKIGQKEIDNLFDQVKNFPELRELEKLTARSGLSKIFGEVGGVVPNKGEIKLLEQVFGKELTDELVKKQGMFKRFKEAGFEIANIPRSFMTSADLSFGFRQGLFVMARHPKIFFQNFAKQFKLFGSEKYYQQVLKDIHGSPNFDKMQKHGLSFTELGADIAKREEGFMSSFAEKIPIAGRVVRASGRAYTGFANKLRADLFDYMVDYGKKFGKEESTRYLDDAANFINHATGRGKLPFGTEKAAVALNTVFFSPRLLMSRIQLLNPVFYIKLEPTVRKEALKSLLAFGGMATAITGLAKMGGADVGTDPRNADFAKIKIGNTRYDPLGGFQQPIRTAAQILSGKLISSTTGKELTLGEGYKPLTPLGIAARFFEMKEAPLASFATSLMRGTNVIGEKFDLPTEVANRFVPMVMQDMNDLYREKGLEGIPMAAPAIFGVGVQTYGGVQTWGLDGKDYPKLNKELRRLNTTMGFPATSAFGFEFDSDKYKRFREVAGKKIATNLTNFINSEDYKEFDDTQRKLIIGKRIDILKRTFKKQLFPEENKRSLIKSQLIQSGIEDNKLEEEVNKRLKELEN